MSGEVTKNNGIAPSDAGRLLREELARRASRNPKYSLRAFAKTLGLSSSFVSKLMNGQRPLTQKTLEKISPHLSLSPVQVSNLMASMGEKRDSSLEFDNLDPDRFQLISDWYHFAILELSSVQGILLNLKSVSACLGISIHEAKVALERLQRLGLLNQQNELNPATVRNFSTLGPKFASEANRNQQRQILQMAIRALDEIPFEQRDQSSVTLAIPRSRLNEAKAKITAFRREFSRDLQRPGERDSVYHLSISFYPVSVSQVTVSHSKKSKSPKENIQ
jgi:transcriptional regulator with XRE-family HTH domain